jgi:hypothetical protein
MYEKIPPVIMESLKRYRDNHTPVGGFLRAVLENDLFNAWARGDSNSIAALQDITSFVYWELPSIAWGSADAYMKWIDNKGRAA